MLKARQLSYNMMSGYKQGQLNDLCKKSNNTQEFYDANWRRSLDLNRKNRKLHIIINPLSLLVCFSHQQTATTNKYQFRQCLRAN